MKNKFTNFFNRFCANTPQNTGGGNSRKVNFATTMWNGSKPTVNRRSTDSQSQDHRNHTPISKALKYAAMIFMVLTLGIGNVWGQSFTFENSNSTTTVTTNNITYTCDGSGTSTTRFGSSLKFMNLGSGKKIQFVSTTNNISRIEIKACANNSAAKKCMTIKTSADASSYSVPSTFTATLDGSPAASVEDMSLTGTGVSDWQTLVINFNANATLPMAFQILRGSNNLSVYSVKVYTAPTALATSDVTSEGVTFTVTDGASTNNYDIYYSTSTSVPNSGTSASTTISSAKTKSITGLESGQTYYAWVRSTWSSGTIKGDWRPSTASVSFTTESAGGGCGSTEQAALELSASSGTICGTGTTTFTVSGGSGEGTLSVSSSDDTKATATIDGTTVTVTGVAAGSATITVSKACDATYAEKTATYSATVAAVPTANAGVDKTTELGNGVALAAAAAADGCTGAWTIQSGPNMATSQLNSTSSATATFTPTAAGTFTLRWTVTNSTSGCSAYDEMTVKAAICSISDCGNATLTYPLNVGTSLVNTAANLVNTPSNGGSAALTVPAADAAVTLSTITISDKDGKNDNNGKAAAATNACYPTAPTMSSKIGMYNGSSYSSSNYLQFAFTVNSGYTFTPCDIQFTVQPVSNEASFRWEVTDGTNIYGYGTGDAPVGSGNGATVLTGLTSTSEMAAGDYYIRLYPYYNGSNTFRISNDVILKGTTAEAVAPSCTTLDAPTGLSCTGHTSASLTFGWTAAEHASSYDVKLWDNSACTGEPVASENIASTSKTFTGLTDETTYYCKVQSKGDGETYCTDGGTTDAVSGTTDALPSYTVTAVTSTGDNTRGTVSAAASSIKAGATTTITAVPATGYRVANWAVSGTGATISPSGASNSLTTTLTMGTADATVTVTFEEIPCPTSGTVFKMEALKLCTCTIASKTTYPLTSSDNYTITGGALELSNVGNSQKVLMTKNQSSLIQWSWNTNDVGFHITTTCPLQAGDTIKYTTNQTAYDVYINEEASKGSSSDSTIKADSKYYIVKAGDRFVGDNSIYLWRSGSSTYMRTIEILRPAKYAMTFAKGDEDAGGTMDAQSVIEKSLVTLPACTFTAPEGKEFDAWVVTKTAGGAAVSVTDGKFTMPQEAVTLTATWKTKTVKYAVTYVLNGPSGDAPTETNKAEDAEFSLAAAPSWAGHVFKGWQWTDGEEVTHLEAAASSFTMPAYAVTFTAQWKLDPNASMANAKYVIGGSALNMAAKFESLNTESSVTFSLKEEYVGASITEAGSFSATVAGEYIVVANQAGNASYEEAEVEATVEVLESEVSDTYIWKKDAGYTGCVANPDADAPAALYTDITYEGFTGMGRAAEDNTECILTFSIKNTYKSLFGIKDICTYGKLEEPLGGQISWDGGTNWEDLAKYSEGKKVFDAPSTFPTSFKIKFFGVSKSSGGLYWRNALVTLERKKEVVSTVIDLTDVKINGTSISAANLETLKTADAYALDLADEYVTAPALKFNKHTVITYEDDSQVEKDDVISKTATVNLSGKWEASAEINEITYTVTMAKADAFIVHYYQADGETLIGSENVAVSGHPTAAGITPTPQDYKRVVWTLSDEPVDLEDVTSDVAGTEINLVASYVTAYARSINIEQWVLDNKVANKAGFIAELDGKGYKQVDLNALDSLNDDPSKANRNYAFLGMKVNKTTSAISLLLKAGSTVKARFGNMGSSVNVTIGEAEPVELTSGDYANTSVSSAKEYSYTAEADVIVKFQSTGTSTVVFKQIMIDEAIATVKLPAIVTYDANGGTFGKASEKYTGTPLVIGDATPADEDYEFEGWHVGSVEGEKINAAAYEPTANVTLVAKYVAKPSPFSLSALTYQIGAGAATAVGYVEGTYEYDVELPYAGSYETITVAYTLADGTSSTKAGAVLDVTSVPGAATFTIVADNEAEKTYTVNFKKEAKDGLEIIGAVVTGNTTATVTGLYAGTASVKLNDKKIDKGDYYIYVTLKEGQTLQNGDVLVVDVNTKSGIGTCALEICTGEGNLNNGILTSVAVDDYSTGENRIVLANVPAGATSVGLKRSDNLNAKIDGLKVYRPMNPVLKSITFDGTKIEVAGTAVEETLPYATDLAEVTPEIFWNGAGTAVVSTNEGEWAWGDNTYVLTDKDGDATTYTITLVRAERSSDKTLSSLTVDGNAVELKEGVYDYIYEYPYGTDPATVPVVAAEANDAHASVGTITQAATTAGTASFTVTAEDETSQDYTVSFTISRVPGLVIYDGSTMDAIAESGSDGETGFAWTMVGGKTDGGKDISVTLNGKTYTKSQNVFGSPTTSDTRYIEITIPEGYLAKFYLAGATNNGGETRSSYISKEKTGTLDQSIAYASTDSYDGAAMYSALQLPGTYYYCADKSIRLYELSVQLYPIDYSRSVTDGRLGTICLPKGGTMVGAAVYEVAYFNPDNRKIYFDEVLSGEMEPGMPYVFLPDQGNNDQLVVTYGNNAAAAEAGHHNGLYGSFTEELLTKNTVNYIFSANKYWYVNSDEVYVGANRAYLKVQEIYGYEGQPEPAPAPGRRRVVMDSGDQAPQITTGMENVQPEAVRSAKVLINGKMYILRGEKMYDVTGKLVK